MSNIFNLGLFVTQMNNALNRKLLHVKVKRTKANLEILKILNEEGVIRYFKILDDRLILVGLKYYNTNRIPNEFKIISKPGSRIYTKRRNLFLDFFCGHRSHGFYIITTSEGGYTTSTESLLFKRKMGEVILWIGI